MEKGAEAEDTAAKRDKANELFAQGRGPGHQEIQALGLTPWIAESYYRDWRELQQQPPEPVVPEPVVSEDVAKVPQPGEPVEVSSLGTLRLFKFKGGTYSKHRVHSAGVTCVSKAGNKVLTLSPDTIVIPT